ncbi:NAD-dependent epimerase/dehydratase family protein [Alkalicoccobacillus porphyridii]|uniref:NAD-dependent epimerase/dehydratase family protein n=1 Tax=Alkalicoccobacillus porphyridii TaxID=2597270 RepID=UPI00163D75AA|nr:NAD-dependent epimerase/dehydratase family protein [Alkalicoccobacillus porphyridii]
MHDKKALVIGASGLVGTELLDTLLQKDTYSEIFVLARKPLQITHNKLQVFIVNFDTLEEEYPTIDPEDVFCCLGTTIKQAKTKENMYKIDVEYPFKVAILAMKHGLNHFLLVSAVGANSSSRIFYSRIKGEVEDKLLSLNIPKVSIFRPSLLVGNREEFRLGELFAIKIFQFTSWIFPVTIQAKMGIKPSVVAQAMYHSAVHDKKPITMYDAVRMNEIMDK